MYFPLSFEPVSGSNQTLLSSKFLKTDTLWKLSDECYFFIQCILTILCILSLSWIKVEVVNNTCSHFHFIFVWRHCVDKPVFLKNQQKKPAIILNCTKHAVKQNSSVCDQKGICSLSWEIISIFKL